MLRCSLLPAVACRDEDGLCFDTPNLESHRHSVNDFFFFFLGGFPFFFVKRDERSRGPHSTHERQKTHVFNNIILLFIFF